MASIAVTLLYFAQMAQQRGLGEEQIQTTAATPSELFDQLNEKYHFAEHKDNLRVAINDQYAHWEKPLSADDTIVFIAPVAGG